MSARLGTLTLDLVAKTGNFVSGTEKSRKALNKFAKDARKSANEIGRGMSVAAVAAVGAITLIVNKQRELIDTQAKLSQELNTSYKSLSNLERAGGLAGVGMAKISTASKLLNVNIGEAINGTAAQAEAFERLGLSAEAVAELPLDERIKAVNVALRDNVAQAERASVAADLFGSKNAAAIQMLTPDVIAQATEEVELFGLALSDVDAAKVELANDAISTLGLLSDGAQKQLTIALAPAIQAVGDMFLQASKDAGGMGNAVTDAVDTAIKALSFVADAADGVGRVFSVVADSIIIGWNSVFVFISEGLSVALKAADYLPGIDFTNAIKSVEGFSNTSKGVVREAANNIKETLEEPLAGVAFLETYEQIKKTSQEAAEAAVAGREAEKEASEEAAKAARDALELEQARKELAEQKIIDLKAYRDLVAEQRTDDEKELDTLREKLAVIEAIKDIESISDEEKGEQRDRAIDGAVDGAVGEDSGFSDTGTSGFSQFDRLDDALAKEEEFYANKLDLLKEFQEQKLITDEEFYELELEAKQAHEDAMASIEKARQNAMLDTTAQALGSIAKLQNSENKKARKVGKAAAIAQATINTYQAATGALSSFSAIPIVGTALGIAAAAAITAMGLQQVSKIKGQAHDGIDFVPTSGTWNLEKGERVVTNQTSKKLDRTLDEIRSGGTTNNSSRNNNITNNITLVGGEDGRRTASQIANETMTRQQIAQARFG